MMGRSIKTKIFAAILVPLILFEVLIFGFYSERLTREFNSRYEQMATTISSPFLRAIERKLASLTDLEDRRGFLGVYVELKGAIEFEDWRRQYTFLDGVSFTDELSRVLVSTKGSEDFDFMQSGEHNAILSSKTESQIAVAVPLRQNNHYFGSINFWFTKAEIEKEREKAILVTLLFFFIALILGGFLSWLLSTAITRPINTLASDSEQIATGKLNHEICLPDTHGEIGLLTKNFRVMRDAIRDKISELEKRNIHLAKEIGKRKKAQDELQKHRDQLESMVKERTEKLRVSNEALQYSESRFRALSDAAFEAIIISQTGAIIEANRTFSDMFGYQLTEVIGNSPGDLFAPDAREDVQDKIHSGFEGSYQSSCLRKDGTIFPVEIHERIFIYHQQQVKITGIRDISEKVEAEKQIKELQEIVPICAKCKKIRDDKGYWNIVELYFQQHSEMSFSHGICPECVEDLYGSQDWYIRKKKEKDG